MTQDRLAAPDWAMAFLTTNQVFIHRAALRHRGVPKPVEDVAPVYGEVKGARAGRTTRRRGRGCPVGVMKRMAASVSQAGQVRQWLA